MSIVRVNLAGTGKDLNLPPDTLAIDFPPDMQPHPPMAVGLLGDIVARASGEFLCSVWLSADQNPVGRPMWWGCVVNLPAPKKRRWASTLARETARSLLFDDGAE